jgi:hypothetical protein
MTMVTREKEAKRSKMLIYGSTHDYRPIGGELC